MTKLIYAPGTKVRYTGSSRRGYQRKVGIETIITQVSLDTGSIEYATLEGAWFAHTHFEWVADPTAASLKKVFKDLRDESEDEDD